MTDHDHPDGSGAGPRAAGAAYDDAVRMLARRPLTEREVRLRLGRRGHADPEVDAAVSRLTAAGYLDDARLARHYIGARSERLGHGRDRLLRELELRGVDRATARRCWAEAADADGIDPRATLAREVRRRVDRAGGALDPRAYRRVYNALLRAGHDAASVAEELEPFRDAPVEFDGAARDGTDDDVP